MFLPARNRFTAFTLEQLFVVRQLTNALYLAGNFERCARMTILDDGVLFVHPTRRVVFVDKVVRLLLLR